MVDVRERRWKRDADFGFWIWIFGGNLCPIGIQTRLDELVVFHNATLPKQFLLELVLSVSLPVCRLHLF